MGVQLATLVTLALCITGSMAICWEHLHVKYALMDGFFNIPRTVTDIKKENFVLMDHDDELNVDLYSFPYDPRVSVLFDSHGNIAGMRTAYIKSDVDKRAKAKGIPFKYSYANKPIFSSGTYHGIDVWYTSVLFISPEQLMAGGREVTEGRVAEEIYMKLDGKWTKIPKDECQAEALGFTKQSCFIGMGMHYFYKVTPNMKCEDFQGAFLLYESGELIGLGFNPFGSFTTKDREWFEDVPANVVTKIVSNGPSCVKQFVRDYGDTAFHIFFKKFPRLTFCTWPWQKSDQCQKK